MYGLEVREIGERREVGAEIMADEVNVPNSGGRDCRRTPTSRLETMRRGLYIAGVIE